MTIGPISTAVSIPSVGSSDVLSPEATAAAAAARQNQDGPTVNERDRRIAFYKERIESLNKVASLHIPESFKAQIKADIAGYTEELARETAFNLLMKTSWATGASASTVAALDSMEVMTVPDADLDGASAIFNEDEGVVYLAQSVFDKIVESTKELNKQGLLDLTSGAVKDPNALKGSAAYHNLVAAQALALLENTHKQDAANGVEGQDDANFEQVSDWVREQAQQASQLPDGAREQRIEDLKYYLVSEYIGTYELNAYQAQEKHMFEMGQPPKEHGWLTIGNDGKFLDKETAVKNIVAFLPSDLKETLFTESLNPTGASEGAEVGPDHPGRFHPGRFHPGRFHPGRFHPGRFHPGRFHPGRFHPGVAEFIDLKTGAVQKSPTSTDATK